MIEYLESRQLMTAVLPVPSQNLETISAANAHGLCETVTSPNHSVAQTVFSASSSSNSANSGTSISSFTLGGYADSTSMVTLDWTKATGATGYQVDIWQNNVWRSIGTFNSSTTAVNVTGLSAGTTYYFDVGAYNSSTTLWANYIGIKTFSANTAPTTPTLTASATSSSQVQLNWTSATGATSYVIDEWVNNSWVQLGTVGAGTTSTTVSGLNAGTTYYFDVGASNAFGTTWAAYKSVTTPSSNNTVEPSAKYGSYTAVSGSLFGANGPQFTDVHQGNVGDCWLLSSFAAVAARYPSDITSMFTAAGTSVVNGTTVNDYKVRFYNSSGQAEYVTVDTELPKIGSSFAYDIANNGVLWVALLEKAYAEANGMGYVTTSHPNQNSYESLDSGYPGWALQAITGKSVGSYSVNPANLAAAWNAGNIIVMSSSPHANDNLIVGDSTGTHAYAVVGYNPSSASPFELSNPWGVSSTVNGLYNWNGHNVYGGAFWANSSLLSQDFAGQTIGSGITFNSLSSDANSSWTFTLPIAESATNIVQDDGHNSRPRTPSTNGAFSTAPTSQGSTFQADEFRFDFKPKATA
jgi:Calpain family cysteine protease